MSQHRRVTDFFKEVNKSELKDEFELEDIPLDDIKSKVETWQKTKFGKYYTLYPQSETKITLKKEKYNWNVFYLVTIIVALLFNSLLTMDFPPGTPVEVTTAILYTGIPATIAFYYIVSIFLLVRLVKASYTLTFDIGSQHLVELEGQGKIWKSMHEIHTLKLSLRKRIQSPLALV